MAGAAFRWRFAIEASSPTTRDQAPDARARSSAAPPQTLYRHHRQHHDQPIFSDRSKDIILDGPDQLWVADLTYVAISGGFAYVPIILDAWSRRVVGYAIGRSLDSRSRH
jgi:transposase InsO family protein